MSLVGLKFPLTREPNSTALDILFVAAMFFIISESVDVVSPKVSASIYFLQ